MVLEIILLGWISSFLIKYVLNLAGDMILIDKAVKVLFGWSKSL